MIIRPDIIGQLIRRRQLQDQIGELSSTLKALESELRSIDCGLNNDSDIPDLCQVFIHDHPYLLVRRSGHVEMIDGLRAGTCREFLPITGTNG